MASLPFSKPKKQKLIVGGAIILFFAISFAGGRGAQRHGMRNAITAIGNSLIRETNSYRLHGIDSTLQLTIAEVLSSKTRVAQVVIDHHPIFGTTARARMILSNDMGHAINMDLRTDDSHIYQVLSYSTVSEPRTNSALH